MDVQKLNNYNSRTAEVYQNYGHNLVVYFLGIYHTNQKEEDHTLQPILIH
jgi:hypothetical protein